MTSDAGTGATVLVVDDESSLADLYAHWLGEEYDVRTAYGGDEAVETIDETVDVLLLDRRMPDRSGDEVLEWVRRRGYDVRVAMVTAVEPDLDIVDMPCQDYLVKSVEREELLDTVERLLRVAEYDQKRRELSSKRVRRNVLRVEKSDDELANSEAFQRLEERIDRLERELGAMSEQIDPEGVGRRV